MTSELLLARRLLEAVVDPDAPRTVADEAAAELAELSVRLGVPPGRALPIETFEGMRADDLSPAAWLYLLESGNAEEPEIPVDILEALFLECSDAAIRFRLVRGALGHPRTRARYIAALERQPEPENIATLPESWPKQRLDALQSLAETLTGTEAADALQEFILYLLQDGSEAALALAAGAVAPDEDWRKPAWELARSVVLSTDPQLTGYGRAFRRALIRD